MIQKCYFTKFPNTKKLNKFHNPRNISKQKSVNRGQYMDFVN